MRLKQTNKRERNQTKGLSADIIVALSLKGAGSFYGGLKKLSGSCDTDGCTLRW